MAIKFYYDDFNPTNYEVSSQNPLVCRLIENEPRSKSNFEPLELISYIQGDSVNINIRNTYENASNQGGPLDKLRNIYESYRAPALAGGTGIAGLVSNAILPAAAGFSSLISKDGGATKFLEMLKGAKNDGQWRGLLNNQLEVADDYLYIFKGSTIDYPKSLTVTLVSDQIDKDIYKILEKIIDRTVGDYHTLGDSMGFQLAPNGYKSSLSGLRENTRRTTNTIDGTFTLYVHTKDDEQLPGWRFPGMIIENCSIEFSNAKVNISDGDHPIYRPLTATVTLELLSVVRQSKNMLKENLGMFKSGKVSRAAITEGADRETNTSPTTNLFS